MRALRGFLREIVRVVRSEFNYTAFVRSLMQERTEPEFTQLEPPHKVGQVRWGCHLVVLNLEAERQVQTVGARLKNRLYCSVLCSVCVCV